jgi:hypothetical protein
MSPDNEPVPWEEILEYRLATLKSEIDKAKPLPEEPPQEQRKLFTGLDCCPGQQDLFET